MYDWFNQALWEKCFSLERFTIGCSTGVPPVALRARAQAGRLCYSQVPTALSDPKLREQAKVRLPLYADRLRAFKEVYGRIIPWHVRISLHLDASANKHDERPFAYVYVIWQDEAHGFHMFRERWVKHSDRWFIRVVGLVANRRESVHDED